MDFKSLGLIAPILKALAVQGYVSPTPIQEQAIPPVLAGRDVLGCAQTGTGKTCAFAAPILQLLNGTPASGRPIRALVLTPTRELAIQIYECFRAYGKGLSLRSAVIYGGVGQAAQAEALKKGVDILVATPGRLLDLQGQGLVDLSDVKIFVLDEADRMLDMGFIHDVRRVLKLLPDRKQTLFFSATMPPEVTSLVNSLLKDPVRLAVDPVSSPVESIRQSVYLVDRGNKTRLLAGLLGDPGVKNALVFTRTKHRANKVAQDLLKMGIAAAAIHGNKSQTARQQALSDFKEGRLKVLVATDIAARGLDIEELSHVFNYNLPEVPETYVHRIGRTGRAGHGGTAVSFCDCTEQSLLKGIEKLIGKSIPVAENRDWPMTVFEAPAKDSRGRTVNPDDAEARAAAKKRSRTAGTGKQTEQRTKQRTKQQTEAAAPAGKEPKKTEAAGSGKRPRLRKKRAATISEVLEADAPAGAERPESYSDFHRPDPLAGNVIMDATARLLAPKSHAAASAKAAGGHAGHAGKASARRQKEAGRKRPDRKAAEPSPAPRPHAGRGRRGPPPVELRKSRQKDSTEQPSLMKPYYLKRDD